MDGRRDPTACGRNTQRVMQGRGRTSWTPSKKKTSLSAALLAWPEEASLAEVAGNLPETECWPCVQRKGLLSGVVCRSATNTVMQTKFTEFRISGPCGLSQFRVAAAPSRALRYFKYCYYLLSIVLSDFYVTARTALSCKVYESGSSVQQIMDLPLSSARCSCQAAPRSRQSHKGPSALPAAVRGVDYCSLTGIGVFCGQALLNSVQRSCPSAHRNSSLLHA